MIKKEKACTSHFLYDDVMKGDIDCPLFALFYVLFATLIILGEILVYINHKYRHE